MILVFYGWYKTNRPDVSLRLVGNTINQLSQICPLNPFGWDNDHICRMLQTSGFVIPKQSFTS